MQTTGLSSCEEDLTVDSEHKAVTFHPLRWQGVQSAAFHLSWLSLFCASFGFIAPVALLPVLREDLDLKDADVVSANLASASGAVSALLLAGVACDTFGPKYAVAGVLLLTAPVLLSFGLVTSAAAFVVVRFLLGFSAGAFVGCQYWCTAMFSVRIVGQVNASAAGWGHTGCWVSFLVMPELVEGLQKCMPDFEAWRWAIGLPGLMQILVGMIILAFGEDVPNGAIQKLYDQLEVTPPKTFKGFRTAISNYRLWLLSWTCAFSWGWDLAIQYELVSYLTDKFSLSCKGVGALIPIFGFFGIFSRMLGGYLSDTVAQVHGMKGRLAVLWLSQSFSALLIVLLGASSQSLLATLIILGAFSVFSMASQGETFAIVPFISKRAHGTVCGFVSAGGVFGSALFQSIFLQASNMEASTDMLIMGMLALICTQPILMLKFPQWGGLLHPPNNGIVEEDYYLEEYTHSEIARGDAHASLIFAVESRTQRSAEYKHERTGIKIRNELRVSDSSSIECSNTRYRCSV